MAKLILLVDDSATIQQLVALAFRGEDIKLLSAETAQQADEILDQNRPDLILVDISLPDRDGLDFLSQLRTRPATALTPMILLVPSSSQFELDRAHRSGADAVLMKPFESMTSLVETVNLLAGAPSQLLEAAPEIVATRDFSPSDNDDDESDSILELDPDPEVTAPPTAATSLGLQLPPDIIELIASRIAIELTDRLNQEVVGRAVPEVIRIVLERLADKSGSEDSNVPLDIDEARRNLDD